VTCDLLVGASPLGQLRIISRNHRKKCASAAKSFARSWPCTQGCWNQVLFNIFGAAARYRRASVGSSHNDAHPDNSTLHTAKFTFFRCTSAHLFFSCCDSVAAPRQRPEHYDQVLVKNNEQRRRHRPRRTGIIRRCTRVQNTLFRQTSAELFIS
jgi:hypothetical protein